MSLKTYVLKLTGGISIDGEVLRPGTLVELVESDAKSLLARGKAVLATVEGDLHIGSGGSKPADVKADPAVLAAVIDETAKADAAANTETPPADGAPAAVDDPAAK